MKSGLCACISSRITTVIHVSRSNWIYYNWYNEPFAVSPKISLNSDMHGLIFETSIWLLAGSTRWKWVVKLCHADNSSTIIYHELMPTTNKCWTIPVRTIATCAQQSPRPEIETVNVLSMRTSYPIAPNMCQPSLQRQPVALPQQTITRKPRNICFWLSWEIVLQAANLESTHRWHFHTTCIRFKIDKKKSPPLHTYRIEYCICFCLFSFLTCTAGLCLAPVKKKAIRKLLLNGATAWLHLVVLWSKCGGAESQIYSIFHIISHPHETSSIQSRSSDWLAAYCWIFLLVLFACCWICLLLSLSFCGQNAMVPRAKYIAFSI